jgi:DNA-binding NtrC family response regulator
MTDENETADDAPPAARRKKAVPGLALLWSASSPTCRKFQFAGRPLDIGRDEHCNIALPWDNVASRRHVELSYDAGDVRVRDLSSRNGTYVDGERITAPETFTPPFVLRVGGAVFRVEPDVSRFDARQNLIERDTVLGPEMDHVWRLTTEAAMQGRTLLIRGATGTGKERVAKLFHSAGPRASGPLVTVNCSRLEGGTADVTLFGAARGAYTGSDRDRAGAFERADKGVLFLEEIGELPLEAQAKLLRVVEDMIVEPLGGGAKKVDVAICCASHANLRALVARGAFREDLFNRLRQREVTLPPLRERPEEVPFFVEMIRSKTAGAPPASARFIEACLLHPWRGNVREIWIEVEKAIAEALRNDAPTLEPPADGFDPGPLPEGLDAHEAPAPPADPGRSAKAPRTPREIHDEAAFMALKKYDGNVAAAMASVGMKKTAFYAALERRRKRVT